MPDISPKTALIAILVVAGIIFLWTLTPEVFGDIFGAIQRAVQDMIGTAKSIDIPTK